MNLSVGEEDRIDEGVPLIRLVYRLLNQVISSLLVSVHHHDEAPMPVLADLRAFLKGCLSEGDVSRLRPGDG